MTDVQRTARGATAHDRTTLGSVTFASNNGDIAGGEMMLFAMAQAARELGYDVTIVAPSEPRMVVERAMDENFRTVEIQASDTRSYLLGLRRWDARHRRGLLWCNGLRPGLATAGHRNRVLHLHQAPRSRAQERFYRLARGKARRIFVPSLAMVAAVPDAEPLWNWNAGVPVTRRTPPGSADPIRLGFMGRHSTDKGLAVLGEAVALLEAAEPGRHRLVLAGDGRFVPQADIDQVQRSLDKVRHLIDELGWVSREDFFAAVDLAVFPSVWPEPFGLVASEAMAAGIPFVISDAGGLPEVAGPEHPWIARAADPSSLARVLRNASTELSTWDPKPAIARWDEHFSPVAGRQRLGKALRELGLQPVAGGNS